MNAVEQEPARETEMLEKLQQKLKELAAMARPTIDPTQFNDPLAEQVEWMPMKAGGTNFRTRRLAPGLGNRMEFRAAAGAKLFCLLFLFVGLGVLAGAVVMAVKGTEGVLPVILLGLLGLVFAASAGACCTS
jgi:hypothetical protein